MQQNKDDITIKTIEDATAAIGQILVQRQQTLATAESCTGGLISEQITNTPGSSAYFLGGIVSYANSMKTALLGVKEETLVAVGAVSKETAEQMAVGIRDRSNATFALSVTGIAGPGGGSPEKPVGTVYIALASKENCIVQQFLFSGNRKEIRESTTISALKMLHIHLQTS